MPRRHDKADSAVRGYKALYGVVPTKHAVVMCCAVAEGESQCGDAWNHSGNWGAVQRRSMDATERALVKSGGTPVAKDPFEMLLHDSDPVSGKFQAWYWRFPVGETDPNSGLQGDDAGAWRLFKTLLEDAHRDKYIKPGFDTIDAYALARLMYQTGYYGGFHDPRKSYAQPDGTTISGAELNIRDYAHAITWNMSAFATDLADWTVDGSPPDPNAIDLSTTLGVQRSLNLLKVVTPALKEDGIFGPKTRAAVLRFQESAKIGVDGIIGPVTRAAITEALAKLA